MKKRIALAALLLHAAAHAQTYTPLSLPSMFADHMVLQQQTKARSVGLGQCGVNRTPGGQLGHGGHHQRPN